MNKAVFIDKDGTLIKNIPFNVDCSLISFYDDAVERGICIVSRPGAKLRYAKGAKYPQP